MFGDAVHRVINRSGHDRYSVAFFVDGRADEELAPFDESKASEKNRGPDGKWWKAGPYLLDRLQTTYTQAEKTDAA